MQTPDPSTISAEVVFQDAFLSVLRAHGVIRASVFGSVAEGTARPDSDIDLLVTFDRPVTLFEQLRLAHELGNVAGRDVDLMTEIHPAFAPYILPTLRPLPLGKHGIRTSS